MDRERTDGERRVSEEFAEATKEQVARFFDAMMEAMTEELRRHPEAYHLRPEPLSEEEADKFALRAVHRARDELGRTTEGRTTRSRLAPAEFQHGSKKFVP